MKIRTLSRHRSRRLLRGRTAVVNQRLFVSAALLVLASLAGCAHYPSVNLFQSTMVSYLPLQSALHPKVPPPTVIKNRPYGHQQTEWRPWMEDCVDQASYPPLNPPQPTEAQPAPSLPPGTSPELPPSPPGATLPPQVPPSQASFSQAQSSESPYSLAPYSQAPYSEAPYSQAPYSEAPYSQAPYSQAPYSEAPYSQAPYSQAPYSQAPPPRATTSPAAYGPSRLPSSQFSPSMR